MTNHTENTNTPVATEGATWQLNALTEALGDLTLTVSDSLSVGRGSDNDVVLGSKQVSRNHAVLSVLNGELYVKDLESSNGTFINEQRIETNKSKRLDANDTLGFASFSFQVSLPVVAISDDEQAVPVMADEPMTSVSTDTDADIKPKNHTTVMPADPVVVEPVVNESVDKEPLVEESVVKEPIVKETLAKEPVDKETGIEEVLSAPDNHESSAVELTAATPVITESTEQTAVTSKEATAPIAPVVDEQAQYDTDAAAHDKTTKTALQEEADPDVLRAKQAATAQFSGTANLGQPRDLGTTGNNAMDQAMNNPANAGQVEKKPSGGWFIWVFIAILIIGLALWLFNKGGM